MKNIQLRLTPYQASKDDIIKKEACKKIGLVSSVDINVVVRRRTIDARQRNIYVNIVVDLYSKDENLEDNQFQIDYKDVSNATKKAIVVGAGPCGLFAALKLIELGIKPIVIERGRDVMARRKDVAGLEKSGILDTESNYSFGEGGAGAFSDGKLYTRSKKRGDVDRILNILHQHGADPNILVEHHPHIGTDKLPKIIKNIRETILKYGGEVYFETKVTDFIINKNKLEGVVTNTKKEFIAPVILATGHSARDIYEVLNSKSIYLEPKTIAIGFRLEHPQTIIDEIRYHSKNGRGEYLPPAEYVYKTQSGDRGVYSFCMCPGGFIVPASTGNEQQVVNGMSPSNRGGKWANAGMVVEVRPEDIVKLNILDKYNSDAMSMVEVCKALEKRSFEAAGRTLNAPAQLMTDFINNKYTSTNIPSSYSLGLTSSNMKEWMPRFITDRLTEAFKKFDKISKGFITQEAQLLAIESRTSSPVRIPRDKETLQHISLHGLFPAGEGAGYAGGIVSAAIDGENVAMALYRYIQ